MTSLSTIAPAPAAPLDTAILVDPIEFIRFEHYRQRTLCDLLGGVADDLYRPGVAEDASWILDYLNSDLPLHIADETEDLIPLLRERCHSRDRVHDVCHVLDREHEADEQAKDRLLDGLGRLAAHDPVKNPFDFVFTALAFQDKLRRHLVWENQTLLPLARKRLSAADVLSLGFSMAQRHGVAWCA